MAWEVRIDKELTNMMQTLLKNLFNSMNPLLNYACGGCFKIFTGAFIVSTLRYRKINFFTTSASL